MTSLEVLLVIIFYPCRWNMSGGLELLKSIIPGKQENVETPHTTAEWEVLLSASPLPTPLPFPSNLERSSDLPRDSIIRWESLRQWPKRWFLKNLDGAYYRSFIQPMELKASLFLPACLCYTSSNQQHTRFPLPSPPLPILLDIGRQTYTIRKRNKRDFVHVVRVELQVFAVGMSCYMCLCFDCCSLPCLSRQNDSFTWRCGVFRVRRLHVTYHP